MFLIRKIEFYIFKIIMNKKEKSFKKILKLLKRHYKVKIINYNINIFIEYQLIRKINNSVELLINIKKMINSLQISKDKKELFLLPVGVL